MVSKRVILGIDNRIRDVRQAVAIAKKQRDQEVFNVPASGGTVNLDGGTSTSGWLPDGSGDGYWGANGQRLCIPVSKHQYELTQSGSDFVNDSGLEVNSVYFDHLLADDSHYLLNGNVITPVATLLAGTIVSATLRPE